MKNTNNTHRHTQKQVDPGRARLCELGSNTQAVWSETRTALAVCRAGNKATEKSSSSSKNNNNAVTKTRKNKVI